MNITTVRVLLALVEAQDLELEQLDVKKKFLHGDLDEETYMDHPEGYKERRKHNLVCKLSKYL